MKGCSISLAAMTAGLLAWPAPGAADVACDAASGARGSLWTADRATASGPDLLARLIDGDAIIGNRARPFPQVTWPRAAAAPDQMAERAAATSKEAAR